MKDQDLMNLAKQMGWKTLNGRWWTDSFDPAQNTWTWDRVKKDLFPKLESTTHDD